MHEKSNIYENMQLHVYCVLVSLFEWAAWASMTTICHGNNSPVYVKVFFETNDNSCNINGREMVNVRFKKLPVTKTGPNGGTMHGHVPVTLTGIDARPDTLNGKHITSACATLTLGDEQHVSEKFLSGDKALQVEVGIGKTWNCQVKEVLKAHCAGCVSSCAIKTRKLLEKTYN